MKRADPQYKLRIPKELKDTLQASAEAEARSLNAEIVHRLILSVAVEHPFSQALTAASRTSDLLAAESECDDDAERMVMLTELLAHYNAEIGKIQKRMNALAMDFAGMSVISQKETPPKRG